MEELIKHGVNVNQRDYNGDTALVLAEQYGHTTVAEFLYGLARNPAGCNLLKLWLAKDIESFKGISRGME